MAELRTFLQELSTVYSHGETGDTPKGENLVGKGDKSVSFRPYLSAMFAGDAAGFPNTVRRRLSGIWR